MGIDASSKGTMKAARIAFALGLLLVGGSASAGLQLAIPNALLVVDSNNQRVLRVALSDGAVTVFSPPPGAQTNLLTSPRGIGVGRDGTIVVANYFEGNLVELDPATGAQFPVAGLLSGPPAIGTLTRDVAVNPRDPAPGTFATLGVVALGELDQVLRTGLSTTGSLLEPYPSPYDPYLGRFVVARAPGTNDPIDYVVATDAIPALLRYVGAADAFTPLWEPAGLDSIDGLDAPLDGPYPLVASYRFDACPSGGNGIKLFTDVTNDGGIDVHAVSCPGPVAYASRTNLLYYVDAGVSPQGIVAIAGIGGGQISIVPVATLPSGATASDMALAYVPEPDAMALGAAALGALARLASRRRH